MVALAIGFAAQSSVLRDMVPLGGIIIWSGAIVDIPSNYHLCNGLDGTPDLQDKFVICASSGLGVGSTGGTVNHDHTLAGPPAIVDAGGSTPVWPAANSTTEVSNMPPYYALAHIQRMS